MCLRGKFLIPSFVHQLGEGFDFFRQLVQKMSIGGYCTASPTPVEPVEMGQSTASIPLET
jgi:hypothetical protein